MQNSETLQNQPSSPLRKDSYVNKQTKFTDYIDKKVKNIQEMKTKTIKTWEKYFQDMKEKTEKYLLKEQKRIINSFEDNINMSLNCITHNYLYNFDHLCIKRNETKNSLTLSKLQPENDQKIQIKFIDSQNQLSVKLQMKKILQQIIVAQNHLNENLKIIGQDLKKQIHKLIEPLRDLFSKIPKFMQIEANSSTLVISENKIESQKKKMNGKKVKKDQVLNVKNLEIFAEKKRVAQLNQKQQNFPSEMTDKLLKKSHLKHQVAFEVKQMPITLQLKPIAEKQDNIVSSINKMIKNLKLLEFDLVNRKSLFHIYEKTSVEKQQQQINLAHQGRNIENQNHLTIELYLNEKRLKIQDSQNNWVYQKHTKISFQSKPDRQYLLILSSKTSEIQRNQQIRKIKMFQFSIFNYKGDIIIKEQINGFQTPQSQKVIQIIQIETQKDFIFLIFNNHLIRLNLKNIKTHKTSLYGTDDKILKASTLEDKLMIFEGRNMVVELLTTDFVTLQRFSWSAYYPNQVRLNKFLNLKLSIQGHHQINHPLQHPQKEIILLIPKIKTDTLHYIQNGFQKTLHFSYSQKKRHLKQKSPMLQMIQSIIGIDHQIYLIISSGFNVNKPKTDFFLLQIAKENENQVDDNVGKSLNGKVTYLDTLYEDITDCKFLKNQLYFQLKSGKVTSFCIY